MELDNSENYKNLESAILSVARALEDEHQTVRYAFNFYRSSSYTGSSGATVSLNATLFDTTGNGMTSSKHTIVKSGYWQINFGVHHSVSAGIGYYVYFVVNNVEYSRGSGVISAYTNGSAWGAETGSNLVWLDEGDVVEIRWVGTSNTIAGGRQHTYMSGYLVTQR